MKVILASSSPRRKELLKEIFDDFCSLSPICDESLLKSPKRSVLSIAKRKADSIKEPFDLIISADTVVVFKNKILGKPIDEADAKRTLYSLSGKTHKVYTGVCIKYKTNGSIKEKVFCAKSYVKMKQLTTSDVDEYVKSGSPLDKAGSYGIQDGVVKNYFGSYTNIVGLPIEKLRKELKKTGLF